VKFLRTLLGAKAFNNPKDHFELARLFDYVTSGDKNAVILDFFAGSGSTGHAVMALNDADGGSYELLLKIGLDLATPIEERQIAGKTVFVMGAGALVVCLARPVTLELVEGVAALKKELQPEVMRVVFRDSGFEDDVVKANAVQILRQAGIEDIKSL